MKPTLYETLRYLFYYEPETGAFYRRMTGELAGCLRDNGYININIAGTTIQAQRLAHLYMTGKIPCGVMDHINGIRSDNRWLNLRDIPRSENNKNCRPYKNSTSGVMGVSWYKITNQWCASINVNGKRKNLGYFKNFDDAVRVRKEAEIQLGYHSNHGRIIPFERAS